MKLQLTQDIQAPADLVWDLLGPRFAELGTWSSATDSSRPLEASEVPADMTVAPEAPVLGRVTPNPLGELREVLTLYSDTDRTFRFEVAAPPPIFEHSESLTSVTELGPDQCRVTMDIVIEPKGIFKLLDPLLRRRILSSSKGPNQLMRDLKQFTEVA